MSDIPFTFRDGERTIRFGPGALDEAVPLLEAVGFAGEWVLLTTERARKTIPAELADRAAAKFHVASGPVPDAAAALMDDVRGRDVVAFGGGRVVDAGKAIVAAGGGRVAAVPTTLAGSSFTPFHRMPAGYESYGATTRPAVAICDPQVMTSAPRETLVATAMNALAHAIEGLYGPLANPVAEGASLRGAPAIITALEADPIDYDELALGAFLGGYSVGVAAGLMVHHATCQTLVSVLGTHHAKTNAVMLPRSIAFMADRAPDQLGRLAAVLDEPDVLGVAARVGKLAAGTGATTLADLGVTEADLDRVLDALLEHPGIEPTPGQPGRDELHELLLSAQPG